MDKYLRNKKINLNFKEDIEPQEVLIDSLAKKREEEMGIKEKKLEVPLSRNILRGFFIFIFILISFLFIKTFHLQVIEGKNLSLLAEQNKFKIYQIQAERGVIYDRNFNQLVWNSPSFDLFLDIRDLPESEGEKLRIFKEVSLILKKEIEELKRQIENSVSPEILIYKNLDHHSLILLKTKIDSNELPGLKIQRNFVRIYKTDPNFSHLIGYTGKISNEELKAEPEQYSIFDWVGKTGLEKFYEKTLRRNPGKIRVERDALGNLISQEIIRLPEGGKSLVLWLDSQLQGKIKQELEKQLKIYGGSGAAAIALDPKTGGILSLISLPDFDNNLFQKGLDEKTLKEILKDPKEPLFNRAISGFYPVGSTIKPLIAAAVLQEQIISPEKKINCQGAIQVRHRYQPEIIYHYRDWKTHGWIDMRRAIAESCNVYFYIVGGGYGNQKGLGPTKIKKYLELFGWTEKTNIDLPNEVTNFVPDPGWKKSYFVKKEDQIWRDGDTYYLSIGQQYIKISPLAVATAFGAIANGGRLFQPQVVQKIIEGSADSARVVAELRPKIIRENFIDSQNLQIVREGMRQAVSSPTGSSYYLNSLPVKVAAKTGTAETGKKDKEGNKLYHNWLTVFAPYEDPQIVLTVMIENVKTMQIPVLEVAKAVLEWYFSNEK